MLRVRGFFELKEDIEGFNREFMKYLIWYNTERIHSGIEGKASLRYFCDKFLKIQPSLISYGLIQKLYIQKNFDIIKSYEKF